MAGKVEINTICQTDMILIGEIDFRISRIEYLTKDLALNPTYVNIPDQVRIFGTRQLTVMDVCFECILVYIDHGGSKAVQTST